jgi:hypothetical protein
VFIVVISFEIQPAALDATARFYLKNLEKLARKVTSKQAKNLMPLPTLMQRTT